MNARSNSVTGGQKYRKVRDHLIHFDKQSLPVARQNISRLFVLAAGSVEAIPAWPFVPCQRVIVVFTYVQMNRAKESSSAPSVKAPCISNGAKWTHQPEKRNRCVKIAGD